MRIVDKVKIEAIPALKNMGYDVKVLPLGAAREIFGDSVFQESGDHVYICANLSEKKKATA